MIRCWSQHYNVPMKKIENDNYRVITFSKRRAEIFCYYGRAEIYKK